jgi:DNA polymerase III epsilon subunit-like protein
VIVLDTETTELVENTLVPLDQQPRIIQLCAAKLDDETLEEVARLKFMCNPGVPIPAEVTKITGFTDADVKDKPKFARYYPQLVDFFFGERTLVAHNLPYDRKLLSYELMRLDKLIQFPWPPEHICTVEATADISGKYLKLTELYEMLTGTKLAQTHHADDDVDALVVCVRKLREHGRL